MAEVADKAVAEVDRGAGHAAQRQAQRIPRLRQLHRAAHGLELLAGQRDRAAEDLQRQPRVAERAADPQLVARPRAAAQQRRTRWHLAHRGDVDGQRPGRGVAAGERDAGRVGQREQPAREAGQPVVVDARQRDRQREGQRLGAAGREVRQVDRQRLVAQALGGHGGQEVAALDQQVAGHRELLPRRQLHQRAVVADAQHERRAGPRRPREVARD